MFVNVCLIFKKLQILCPKVAVYCTLPLAADEGSRFSIFLRTFRIVFWIKSFCGISVSFQFVCHYVTHLSCQVTVCLGMDSFCNKVADDFKKLILRFQFF